MECSVPMESGVSEDVNIIWMTNDGSVVKTVQNVLGDERGNTTIYRHTLWCKINDKTTYIQMPIYIKLKSITQSTGANW